MPNSKLTELIDVRIAKLVPGGQGIGELSDGKKVFVWGALPDEEVKVRIVKKKRDYAEAIAEHIVRSSPDRIMPSEANYLSTSPWQIMSFEAENRYKKYIATELLKQQKLVVPAIAGTTHDDHEWQYRNKMEYSFWGDESGLHLALHNRASHSKQVVSGSKLAMAAIDRAANSICAHLSKMNVRAGDLKTIIVRCSQDDQVVASLFVKTESFDMSELSPNVQGMRVYYSNPKSPASIATKLLCELGNVTLEDTLLGKNFKYNADAFFQVNVPVF